MIVVLVMTLCGQMKTGSLTENVQNWKKNLLTSWVELSLLDSGHLSVQSTSSDSGTLNKALAVICCGMLNVLNMADLNI